MSSLGNAARITEPINADIAASTQLLFEETYLAAVRSLGKMLAGGGMTTKNLCLSGGTALNCPSNSRVWREGPFENVFIEPTCDDDGLAIGTSLHLYHNLLDHPIAASDTPATAYLGGADGDEVLAAALAADGIASETRDDPAKAAANDLLADKIIGWFEGKSEAGPRALGHRSILADVRSAEKADDWFTDCPMPSPYRLFTAEGRGDKLPAITHVDGSSRIQTVDESCGGVQRIDCQDPGGSNRLPDEFGDRRVLY